MLTIIRKYLKNRYSETFGVFTPFNLITLNNLATVFLEGDASQGLGFGVLGFLDESPAVRALQLNSQLTQQFRV